MEKKKLSLNDLKVNSFITQIETNERETFIGAANDNTTDGSIGVICLASWGAWCNLTPLRIKASPLTERIIPFLRSDNGCSGAQFSCPTDPTIQSAGRCYSEQKGCELM
mgnify:CR=1 FL=1